MKVNFVIDSFPTYSETFIYNQIYYLIDKNIDISIYSTKRGGDNIHSKILDYRLMDKVVFFRHGISFCLINNFLRNFNSSYSILRSFSWKKSLFYVLNLDLFKQLDRSDITHTHFGHIGELVCGLIDVGVLRNTKVINSFHGFDILPRRNEYYRSKYKSLFKNASLFTVNSEYTKSILYKLNTVKEDRVVILPVSLDTDYFELKGNRTETPIRLIFVGRLVNWKGPLLSIRILHKLRKKNYNVYLSIVGDGEEMEICKRFVFENSLSDYVRFCGVLDQNSIIEKFAQSHVFLLPGITDPESGRAENQGLVIQEAQAMKLPVVVSNAGGMKYGLIDGVTGYVVEENDLEGFVRRIIYLYNSPEIRQEMGRGGRKYVEENFDYKVLGKKLIEIYNS